MNRCCCCGLLLLLLLVCLSLAFAPAPLPRRGRGAAENDLQRMQGKWVRVELGISAPARPDNCPITITGTLMQFPSPNDAWKLTVDQSRRPNKAIDAAHRDNPATLFRGIYRFDGGRLIICWRGATNDPVRPEDFTPGAQGVWYQVYRRP
jgi:uncharacterized protein (TIGR03067 family)